MDVDTSHQVEKIIKDLSRSVQSETDEAAPPRNKPKAGSPPPKRESKRSKWKRTPYTEGKGKKKQKEMIDLISSPEYVHTEKKVSHFYPGNQYPTWDALRLKPMSAEEKSLLGKLNKDLENPDDFDIRILNSSGAFVHNFRISSTVSTRLNTAENNCLTKFCSQKVHW